MEPWDAEPDRAVAESNEQKTRCMNQSSGHDSTIDERVRGTDTLSVAFSDHNLN
jgi:hypothetical protein